MGDSLAFQHALMEDRNEKGETIHKELHDHDITIGDDVTKEEALHMVELTEEEKIIEKKVRRKVDSLIMPLVVLVYLMNYIDRNNYAAAKLQGLERDLSLSDTQYQVGLSILFVGYVRLSTFVGRTETDGITGSDASSIQCDA